MEYENMNKSEIIEFLLNNNIYSLSRQIDPQKFFREDDTYKISCDGIYYFFENMKTRYRVTFIKLEVEATALHRIIPGKTDKSFKRTNNFKRS